MEIINETRDETRARFVRAVNSSGRIVTVAYVYDDNANGIRLATAECSKRDQFVKKIGRDVSFGRLVTKGGKLVSYDTIGGASYKNIAQYVVNNIDTLNQ